MEGQRKTTKNINNYHTKTFNHDFVLPAEEPVIWIYHVCLQVKRKSEDDTIVVSSECAILLQKNKTRFQIL
jgi:hypothetical protein